MLAIIGGTSLRFTDLPALERRSVSSPFGPAEVLCGDILIMLRHQQGVPPHRINFRANMAALALLGADRVVAIGSSGSLKPAIPPGSLVIPDDYISFAPIPSIHDHAIGHVRPALSVELREELAEIVPDARAGGTYAQTPGPRIETAAEVQMLAGLADIVGMTVASEATLAAELGMECSALCTVDNYANGLGGELLTFDHILETSRQYRNRTEDLIRNIIRELG
ncbi:MAG: MTAP family purine nucleoside phosphorylase [Methanoregulaceae archaeon]|nr:MTAP family purine nucleoside phosphorylase [Methanoregulaceae archaeon]